MRFVSGAVLLLLCYLAPLTMCQREGGAPDELFGKDDDDCSPVHEFFRESRNLPKHLSSSLPDTRPIVVEKSMVCNQAASSCCTPDMENFLQDSFIDQFRFNLVTQKDKWLEAAREQHDKVKDHFMNTINKGNAILDIMFIRTYGPFYNNRKEIFVEFFKDLKDSFANAKDNVEQLFDNFFLQLTRKVFRLLLEHEHYTFTPEFLKCVAARPADLVITGSPLQLKELMSAAFRVPQRLLKMIKDAEKEVERVLEDPVSMECASKLSQLHFCAQCQHRDVTLKPCRTTCTAVMSHCLNYTQRLDPNFLTSFADMNSVLQDMASPFNMDSLLISKMSERISEAVMQIQGQKDKLKTRVFADCGEPTRNVSTAGMTTGPHQASVSNKSDDKSGEVVGEDAGSDAMASERTRRSAAAEESVEDDEDGNEKRRRRRRKNKGRKSRKQRRKHKKNKGRRHNREYDYSNYPVDYSYAEGVPGSSEDYRMNGGGSGASDEIREMIDDVRRLMSKDMYAVAQRIDAAMCNKSAVDEGECWDGSRLVPNIHATPKSPENLEDEDTSGSGSYGMDDVDGFGSADWELDTADRPGISVSKEKVGSAVAPCDGCGTAVALSASALQVAMGSLLCLLSTLRWR